MVNLIDLQEQVVKEIVYDLTGNWQNVCVHFERYTDKKLGSMTIHSNEVRGANGKILDDNPISLEVSDAFKQLQDATPVPEKWTWCIFELSSDGHYEFDFKYGVPPYCQEKIDANA